MASRRWMVWSWAEAQQTWMGVAEGTEAEMKDVLARKRGAAARLLPSARFTATPKTEPPTGPPAPLIPDPVPRAPGACEHVDGSEPACTSPAHFRVLAGTRQADAQLSCSRHLVATVRAQAAVGGRKATVGVL